jgi:hypothetical protein
MNSNYVSGFFIFMSVDLQVMYVYLFLPALWGPLMVAYWLRYCATNRKIAGSIPDGVIGIFH